MALDEVAAGLGGALAVVAEATRPLRLGNLDDPVHEVAGEDGVPHTGRQPHADVARRVSWRRLEAEPGIDHVVGRHEPRPSRVDDGHHAVGDARVLLVPPVLPLLSGISECTNLISRAIQSDRVHIIHEPVLPVSRATLS